MVYSSLWALLICCTATCLAGTQITIGHNGTNSEDCLTGSIACSTLDYVLNNIGEDALIFVEYDHTLLAPVNVTYTTDIDIVVEGSGQSTIHCDGAYISLYGQPNTAIVSLSFNNISWYGCQAEGSAVAGFAFDSLKLLSMANVNVSNCSDMVISNVITATISEANFMSNTFCYAAITFQVTSSFDNAATNITNLLSQSTFSNNMGHSNRSNSATVKFCINSTNANIRATFVCDSVTFDKNYIELAPTLYDDSQVALIVPSANNISSLEMSVNQCSFLDSVANMSTILYFHVESVASQKTRLLIENNLFISNKFNSGELTSIYLTSSALASDSLGSMDILYYKNIARNNTVTVAFGVKYEANYPTNLEIVESTFEQVINGPAIKVTCVDELHRIVMSIKDLLVFDSYMLLTTLNPGLVDIMYSKLAISDSSFMSNIGTPLSLADCEVSVTGALQFTYNVGKHGGAMSVTKATTISTASNASLIFADNSALYGGAMYIYSYENFCFLDDAECNINFTMVNNSASTSGNDIFIVHPTNAINCVSKYFESSCVSSLQSSNFASSVNRIILSPNSLSVSPGENIFLNATLYDAFSHPGTCVASVYLQCYDKVISCGNTTNQLKLQGPTQLTMSNTPFYSNLILLARSMNYTTFELPQLVLECEYTDPVFLNLNLKQECGLGFVYNNATFKCECALSDREGYVCSEVHGKACVSRGIWFGQIEQSGEKVNVLGNCQYLLCNRAAQDCPESIGHHSEDYILLPSTSDEQCSDNRGGTLCSGCSDSATFSFEAKNCIANSQCRSWQPYVTLLLVVLFQLLLALLIKLAANIKELNGLGFLYGPLFYLAVINHLPFSFYAEYYKLDLVISIYTSVFLLNMEFFGQIQWCFFPNLTALENYAFHYIGPVIVAPFLLITVFVARRFPRIQKVAKVSPLQAISLLILLSFWALANTSTRILRVQSFGSQLRARIQPDLEYFSQSHLLLSLVAIAIIVGLILPFVLIILFAPLLMRKFSLIRLRPFLDQLQSSYRDDYRWFPSLYMISWMLIIAVDNTYIIAIEGLLLLVISLLFLLQPYRQKWLNIVNTFLILDLIIITSFLYEQSDPLYVTSSTTKHAIDVLFIILVYLLTIIPLLYITGGAVAIIAYRLGVFAAIMKCWRDRRLRKVDSRLLLEESCADKDGHDRVDNSNLSHGSRLKSSGPVELDNGMRGPGGVVTRQDLLIQEDNECREPLLLLLQEEEQNSAHYGTSQSRNSK